MKLTFDEIRRITFGALEIRETPDGLAFLRCTEKQTAAWYKKNEGLGGRSLSTTGVRLDFHTNSKYVSFLASQGDKFEIAIDGVTHHRIHMGEYREKGEAPRFHLTDPLGNEKDEVRVTIWFPCHGSPAHLSYLDLDDGATVCPHDYDKKFLFIGDSITQGWDARYDSLSYAHRLASFYNADFVNQGIGGAYFNPESFDTIAYDPDIVTVAYGTNDFGHFPTYEEMRRETRLHLSLIAKEYAEKKIFVITPIWRNKREGKKMGTFESCCAIVKEEAELLGLTVIDGLYLVPPIPEFFKDAYLHPNDLGFGIYAENLAREIQKYL